MIRRVIQAVLLIALGAACTAALSTAAALWAPCDHRTDVSSTRLPTELRPELPPEWGVPEPSAHAWFTVTDEWGTGVRYTSVVTSGFDADPRKLFRPVRVLTIKRAGWPLAAMECTSTPVVGATSIVRGGLEAPAWATRDRAWGLPELYATVPVRPIALGFAADTAVFAGVAWGVLFAARAWRRDHRARRGECTACGYSLTGVAGNCPECGGPGRFAHSDPG